MTSTQIVAFVLGLAIGALLSPLIVWGMGKYWFGHLVYSFKYWFNNDGYVRIIMIASATLIIVCGMLLAFGQ